MKKRMLLILAFGLSFAPAVFAGNTGTGEHDKPSEFTVGSVACERDANKPLTPVHGNGAPSIDKSKNAGSTRGI